MTTDKDELERFMKYVMPEPNTGCWFWIGAYIKTTNYGTFRFRNKMNRANRVSYTLFNGEITNGLFVLHKCDNRLCVNPDHLFLGTNKDNMIDMVSKGRQSRGEKNGMSKLTKEQVHKIRSIEGTNVSIAKIYGVTDVLISQIKKRQIWKHIQ